MRIGAALVAALAAALTLVVPRPCGQGDAFAETTGATALGEAIFFDPALSEPAGTSCASCHDPARAFAGDNGSKAGVPAGSRPWALARRSTPSLLYLVYVPTFRFVHQDEDRGMDAEPFGGFFWDGRADTIAALVRQPLTNPREMNNTRGAPQIAAKLRRAPYAAAFEKQFPGALADPDRALDALSLGLEAYLTSPAMAPFSSKYDAYVRGQERLDPAEEAGLAIFKDPQRGGCATCHTLDDTRGTTPDRSMFTDYGYEAVGAPRNTRVRAHDDDGGLCERTDTGSPSRGIQWCASFRTPSLRNAALRTGLMHNGAFTNLRDVVLFYATRATDPKRWYPSGVLFDDTPAPYRGLIGSTAATYRRHEGDPPALTDAEIDAVVAFLRTLTDRQLPARQLRHTNGAKGS